METIHCNLLVHTKIIFTAWDAAENDKFLSLGVANLIIDIDGADSK